MKGPTLNRPQSTTWSALCEVASNGHTMVQDKDQMYTTEKRTAAASLLSPAADPANDKQALVAGRPAVENEDLSVGNEKSCGYLCV